jgi:tetratricopeptide (TPR) repeat protein
VRWGVWPGVTASAVLLGCALVLRGDIRTWALVLAVVILLVTLFAIDRRQAVHERNTTDGRISGQVVQLRDNSGSIILGQSQTAVVELPGDTSVFTGRQVEMDRLTNAVVSAGQQRCPAVVVVHGPVGIGKTALAIRAAHRLAAWCDYCRFVDLGAEPASAQGQGRSEDALARLLADPAVGARQPGSAEGIRALWRNQLSGRRVLLVLDNVHSPDQVLDLLPEHHDYRALAVLVTSRTPHERLGQALNALHMRLEPLLPDDALSLLRRCAGRGFAGTDLAAARDLVRRCGYLPLSIRVYGARLHIESPGSSIARLLREEPGGSDSTAVFIQAYHQLPAAARHLVRHLGVHPGPDFDAGAAAALAGRSADETGESLAVLVDRALIIQDGGRYRMHDQFRLDVAPFPLLDEAGHEPGQDAPLYRLLHHYRQAAVTVATPVEPLLTRHSRPATTRTAHVPDPGRKTAALAWFKAERANVIACLRRATGNAGLADAMVALTDAVAGFLRHEGPWETAVDLHAAAATAATNPRDRAVALNDLSIANRLLARYDPALSCLERAYEAASGLADQHDAALGHGNSRNELGKVTNLLGRHSQSVKALEEALACYRQVGDTIGIANAAKNLGDTCYRLDERDRARKYFHQAVAGYTALRDELGLAEVHNHLGWLYLHGDDQPALALREFRAAQGFAAGHSPLEQGRAAEGVASCLMDLDLGEATRWVREAITNYKSIGATSDLDRALLLLRTLSVQSGQHTG